MAATELRVERLNPNDDEVYLVVWHISDGRYAERGAELVDVETNKAVVTLDMPTAGYVKQLHPGGTHVPIGEPLALIGETEEDLAYRDEVGYRDPAQKSTSAADTAVKATASARELAEQLGFDLSRLRKRGIITRKDVENHFGAHRSERPPTPEYRSVKKTVTPSSVHRAMIERITRSHGNTVPAAVLCECDASRIVDFLGAAKEKGLVYSLLDVALWTLGRVLPKFELVNSSFGGEQIHVFQDVNIGVATDHSGELYTLTVYHVDQKSLAQLAAERRGLALRLMRGNIDLESTLGATFTVSVLDIPGIVTQLPIVPPEQAAILGLGAIDCSSERPRLTATLAYDHRIFSGKYASEFLAELCKELSKLQGL